MCMWKACSSSSVQPTLGGIGVSETSLGDVSPSGFIPWKGFLSNPMSGLLRTLSVLLRPVGLL